MQRKDVTEGARTVVLHRFGAVGAASERTVQAVDERIELLRFELIEATEVGDDALTYRAGVGAEGLDKLQVASAARAADARVHVATVLRINPIKTCRLSIDVTLQRFAELALKFALTH